MATKSWTTASDPVNSQQSLARLLRRLWSHIDKSRRFQISLLFIVMIFASLAEAVSIGAVLPFLGMLTTPDIVFEHPLAQPIINFLDLTEPQQLLMPLTLIFATAALFSGAMRVGLLWFQTRLSYAIGVDFSLSIYHRTLYQPYSVHVSRNSSEVITGISLKAHHVVDSAVLPTLTIVSSALILSAILTVLIAIEPVVAVAAFFGFGSIYGLVIFFTRARLGRDSKRISDASNQVIKALQEGLGGIRDVLIDATQSAYCEIYKSAETPLRRARANVRIIGGIPRFGIEALGMVLIAALAYFLASRDGGILSSIPVLGALAVGAQRLLPVLQQVYSGWSEMRGGQQSLRDTLDLLDQPLPTYVDTPLPDALPFTRSIALENLAFRYKDDAPWVLQDCSLSIAKGSRTGFIGTTGSGKSTLLDIVMGLLHPTGGCMQIDGVRVDEKNQRAWQRHIAHVPQSIFLADTTIAENIAFGVSKHKIDHDRVRLAAQGAQIAKTIEAWDEGYSAFVGERGIRLSGGQRQRIGIARALYKQADVIVFDEATSALDNETEAAVMQAIDSLGEDVTILIVAHRLTTLKNCDQIIDLEHGRVNRVGNYTELLETN